MNPNRIKTTFAAPAVAALALALIAAAAKPAAKPPKLDPGQSPVAQWIWGAAEAAENEIYHFRKSFDSGVPAGKSPQSAWLWITCDNHLVAYLNGKQVAASDNWESPTLVDVTGSVKPGRNVLAVQARNDGSAAGMIAKLLIAKPDGGKVEIVTDNSWTVSARNAQPGANWSVAAFDDSAWKKPHLIGKFGIGPWSNFPGGTGGEATPAEQLTLLPDFKAELLYSVPKATHNSWVAMIPDPKGRLIVSGESGPLFRVTPGKTADDTIVEPIDVPLGHAQGLLWAYDALYVVVNGGGIAGNGSGLYRVTDTNNDDKLDKVETLKRLNGGGEHGPHAVRLGPDGKLYLVAGNFTALPEGVSPNSPHHNWAEDLLLPRNPDGGGHDPHIMAPGGWICRTDKDGKTWEVLCAGLRNTYDIDFNTDGELFTYDSDMEWDTGTPWHRPIRVNLAVSGGEYGWRNGTGKWPEYYPDSLGAVVNTGLGSPTGVTFGTGAKFPAKYQRAFFINDWSYGNVYAVHMTAEGAGYKGTFEKFVYGKPFGVTDVCINTDGHMYLTIGGRGSQSGLYRVTYTGSEPTAPPKPDPSEAAAAEARLLRRTIERYHGRQDPKAVDYVWPFLNRSDRYIRYAARVALEWQPREQWQDKALAERRPTASINALIALIRAASVGYEKSPDKVDRSLQPKIIEALGKLPGPSLSEEQLLEALRAGQLCFIRLGRPDEATADDVIEGLDTMYPSQSNLVNRELCQLLAYLQAPSVVGKSMKLLKEASSQEDQLHYVLCLRGVTRGWTPQLRKDYFTFLNVAENRYRGGHSFKAFMTRIRQDAVATLSEEEKTALADVLQPNATAIPEPAAPPRQFVRNWQMSDLLPLIDQASKGRSYENGKAMMHAAQCLKCHRFGNEGGSNGPDITGAGNRYSATDVLESIVNPSKVISDQYRPTEYVTKDRNVIVGSMEKEDPQYLYVRTHPLAPELVKLAKKDVERQFPSRLSLMPEGLIDSLNETEILDLVAYLRSGGKPDDPAFQK